MASVKNRSEKKVKKRFKKRLPLIIIFLVLLLGVGIFMYPVASNWLSQYTAKSEINSYDNALKKLDNNQIEELEKQAKQYNSDLANRNYDKIKSYNYNKLLSINDIMGYVEIPKIGVYLPIYHGISDDVLQKGVGHMQGTSLPIGGSSTHAVLAGHTGLPTAELFTDLDQLKKGNVFYIHILNKVIAYKVDQIKTVLPQNDSDIQIENGKDYVTLLTCTPYGINDHRLLVRGTRIPYDDNAKNQQIDKEKNENNEKALPLRTILWYAALAVIIFITVITFIILIIPDRKKKQNSNKK